MQRFLFPAWNGHPTSAKVWRAGTATQVSTRARTGLFFFWVWVWNVNFFNVDFASTLTSNNTQIHSSIKNTAIISVSWWSNILAAFTVVERTQWFLCVFIKLSVAHFLFSFGRNSIICYR